MSLAELLESLADLCEAAGDAIMTVYRQPSSMNVSLKQDDSPVTAADLAANRVLVSSLQRLLPQVPIISEENPLPSFAERRQWQRYWLIDPLDGTKEFIEGTDEFTVNVALIEAGEPVLGVVHVPAQQVTYSGARGLGASRRDASGRRAIRTRAAPEHTLAVLTSRRHGVEAVAGMLNHLRAHYRVEAVVRGSSLKFCEIAEGRADLYPRVGPTSEWDTAAAQAVLEAAGGAVLDPDLKPLRYNTKESLINPDFYAIGDASLAWQQLLQAP